MHFKENNALAHVIEKRAEGLLSVSEAHGMEMPGQFAAAADAAREMSIALLLVWHFYGKIGLLFLAFGVGWLVWKIGRSAWLGWARLERLHQVIEQEKYEIEHHRPQEREELMALYQAKGLKGKLLEDVVDVLMADEDRLLKVMLEEELGVTLSAYDHPLKQCLGAAMGSVIALTFSTLGFFLVPLYGMPIASFLLLACSAGLSARYEKNRVIPAIIWNLSIGALAFGIAHYFSQLFFYE